MNAVQAAPVQPWTEDLALRLAVLITLLSAALSLGTAGLITTPVCLLTLGLTLIAGLIVPRWIPGLAKDSPPRTAVAVVAIGLLIAVTAGAGRGAMFSGELSGPLVAAVVELGLPDNVPIGLLAALAAGAMVAVSLELADRRGVQSALVLGVAVLGLASVAAPGTHLLLPLVPGWPAAMFTLTRLTASATASPQAVPETSQPQRSGRAGRHGPRPPMMHRAATTGFAAAQVSARWQVLPILVVIPVSLVMLGLAVVSGAATMGNRSAGFGSASDFPAQSEGREGGYLGGEMDLSSRGSLSSDPLFRVTANSPGLWRAGTLDQYTGRRWLATTPARGLPKFVLGPGGTAQLHDAALPAPPVDSGAFQIEPLQAGATQVLAPGRLLSVASPVLALDADTEGIVAAGDRVFIANRHDFGRYRVRSELLPQTSDPAAETRLGAANRSETRTDSAPVFDEALDPRWTALPQTVTERVRQLGITLVTGAPTRLAAVRAIEAELAGRMTYTLDSPVPPPGADTVDDVLFVSHSGFCEHFASAEVVLLRAAGVPARMAVGFSGGEPEDDGFRALRRSDAHAWVEVWFPGIGWVTSDPTPAAAETRGWWQSLREAVRSQAGEPATWIAAIVLISVSAGGLWLLLRRRATPNDPDQARTMDVDLAAAFTRLERDLLAEGRPRAPNETVAALARRLAQPQPADQPDRPDQPDQPGDPALGRALQVLERALYAPQPPSRQECLSAAGAMDQREGGPATRIR
jgi:hypothetical protein